MEKNRNSKSGMNVYEVSKTKSNRVNPKNAEKKTRNKECGRRLTVADLKNYHTHSPQKSGLHYP